jgi:hypothetical protein
MVHSSKSPAVNDSDFSDITKSNRETLSVHVDRAPAHITPIALMTRDLHTSHGLGKLPDSTYSTDTHLPVSVASENSNISIWSIHSK